MPGRVIPLTPAQPRNGGLNIAIALRTDITDYKNPGSRLHRPHALSSGLSLLEAVVTREGDSTLLTFRAATIGPSSTVAIASIFLARPYVVRLLYFLCNTGINDNCRLRLLVSNNNAVAAGIDETGASVLGDREAGGAVASFANRDAPLPLYFPVRDRGTYLKALFTNGSTGSQDMFAVVGIQWLT